MSVSDQRPTPDDSHAAPGQVTVYFDGSCPLCRREIGIYQGCAGSERLAFVDVAASGTASPAADLDREQALRRFHVRASDGRLLSGAQAFSAMWLMLPGWRWLGRLTALPVIATLAEGAYRVFLVGRPAIQRLARRLERS